MFRLGCETDTSFGRQSLWNPTSILQVQYDTPFVRACLDVIAHLYLEIAGFQRLRPDDRGVCRYFSSGDPFPAERILTRRVRRENTEHHEGGFFRLSMTARDSDDKVATNRVCGSELHPFGSLIQEDLIEDDHEI
jgi:hypothetical protein